jgi:CBS domain-containing protein
MNALKIRAIDAMSGPVVTVKTTTTVKEAVRLLIDRGFSGVPVVDEREAPVGVLSLRDVARYSEWHLESEEAAEDQRDAEIAAELDRKKNLERAESTGLGMHIDSMTRATVGQIMTPRITTVDEEATLDDVISTLDRLKIHRIFVADSRNRLIGVVSTVDVMRALVAVAGGGKGRKKPKTRKRRAPKKRKKRQGRK